MISTKKMQIQIQNRTC